MLFQLVFEVIDQSNPFWVTRPLPSFLISFSLSLATSSQVFGASFTTSSPASFQSRLFMMKSWAFNWLAAPYNLSWYIMPLVVQGTNALSINSSWVAYPQASGMIGSSTPLDA